MDGPAEGVPSASMRELCAALPVFPLPRAVLMPGASMPLHVFEPRYRALVDHCLAGTRVMGIATLRDGADARSDEAPICPEVGVGELVAHQPFPDGRSTIVLQFVGAARIHGELPRQHPFRIVACEPVVVDRHGSDAALAALRVLVLQLGALSPAAAGEARRLVQLEGMDLPDALARRLLEDPEAQRAYLGSARLVDRITAVQGRLATFLARAAPPAADA